jgi:hypothetical protein
MFILQCLALQAQVKALTEHNEEHIKELKKTKPQIPRVEAAVDPSEKVS